MKMPFMNHLKLVLLSLSFFCSCSTVDQSKLNGHWKNETWEFNFAEDKSCSMGMNGVNKTNLKYSLLGNAIEISENGRVIVSGLTIKRLSSDTLIIQFRNLVGSGDHMDNDQVLLREK